MFPVFFPPSHSKALKLSLVILCFQNCASGKCLLTTVLIPHLFKCIPAAKITRANYLGGGRSGERSNLEEQESEKKTGFHRWGGLQFVQLTNFFAIVWEDRTRGNNTCGVGLGRRTLGLGAPSFGRACSAHSLHGPKAESLNLKGVHRNVLMITTHNYIYLLKWFILKVLGPLQNSAGDRKKIKWWWGIHIFISLAQQWSTKSNFAFQGTFKNVWRLFYFYFLFY